jgi:hypothetical protein
MKFAILYNTDDYIDHNNVNIREQIDDLLFDPENFELRDYDDEKSLHLMLKDILNLDGIGLTVCNIWETKDIIYAGYYIDYTEAKYNSDSNIKYNKFASQLTRQNVTSHFVIVKLKLSYSITNNNVRTITIHDTLSEHELLNIFENIFVKNGVVIDVDGKMSYYKYIDNPLEHLILTDKNYDKNYIYHEYEIYTHIIVVVVDVRETSGRINKLGTLLCGKPVNGKIFVGLYRKPDFNENPPYVTLSIERLQNILNIRKKDSNLTTDFSNSDKEYINFDKLLELKLIQHKNLKNKSVSDISGELLNSAVKKQEQ